MLAVTLVRYVASNLTGERFFRCRYRIVIVCSVTGALISYFCLGKNKLYVAATTKRNEHEGERSRNAKY